MSSAITPDRLSVRQESLPLSAPFRIARGAKTAAEVMVVEVGYGDYVGYGEAVPYKRYGESMADCVRQAEGLASVLPDRVRLQSLLSAGAARNAVDCALWDLEARVRGVAVADLLSLKPASRIETAYTISGDAPKACAAAAAAHKDKSLLKMKLMGDGADADRLRAVRSVRGDVGLIADANEAWDRDLYLFMSDILLEVGVDLLEQPFAAGSDDMLSELARPISVCADESCLVMGDLSRLCGLYDVVNIKLDKCGGLTHACEVRRTAMGLGFGVMVGCMVGSSLGMRAALPLCDGADWVDLDGPLWLAEDREDGLCYEGNVIIFS